MSCIKKELNPKGAHLEKKDPLFHWCISDAFDDKVQISRSRKTAFLTGSLIWCYTSVAYISAWGHWSHLIFWNVIANVRLRNDDKYLFLCTLYILLWRSTSHWIRKNCMKDRYGWKDSRKRTLFKFRRRAIGRNVSRLEILYDGQFAPSI